MTSEKKLTHVDPVSSGKVVAAIAGLFGLIAGLIPFFAALFGAAIAGDGVEIGIALALGGMLFFPLAYAVFGFIQGVIGAFIYNVTERFHGGLQVTIQSNPTAGQENNSEKQQQEEDSDSTAE